MKKFNEWHAERMLTESVAQMVDKMSDEQLMAMDMGKFMKLYNKAHNEMSAGFAGGRQFGIDWPTLQATEPEWYDRLKRLIKIGKAKQQQSPKTDLGNVLLQQKNAMELVLRAVKKKPGSLPSDIEKETGMDERTISYALIRLVRTGKIKQGEGYSGYAVV